MSNYATLKAAVQAVVKSNGNKEITGTNMQSTLLDMITSLAGGYLFKGIGTTSTSPGTPDQNVFYITGAGTFTNFGDTSYTVPVGSIGIFKYNGSWSRGKINIYNGEDAQPTPGSSNLVESGGTFTQISEAVSPISGLRPETGFLSAAGNYNTNGTGYLIPVTQGDSVYLRNESTTYNCFYAFLTSSSRPYTLVDGTRYSISTGASATITIPSGCTSLWVADSYNNLIGVYKPAQVKVNGNELMVSMIGNKHIIYGNAFINDSDVTSLSDVLQAIPLN